MDSLAIQVGFITRRIQVPNNRALKGYGDMCTQGLGFSVLGWFSGFRLRV